MTGLCFNGWVYVTGHSDWTLRILCFHSKAEPSNKETINGWVRTKPITEDEDGNPPDVKYFPPFPCGVTNNVYPLLELDLHGNETIYAPFTSWESRHMWMNHTRSEEIAATVPKDPLTGHRVRVLYDKPFTYRNRSGRVKKFRLNKMIKMNHNYSFNQGTIYGDRHVRSDGHFDLQPGDFLGYPNASMPLYVMFIVQANKPGRVMGDSAWEEREVHGTGEMQDARKLVPRKRKPGKLEDAQPQDTIPRSLRFPANYIPSFRDMARRELSIAEGAAHPNRRGARILHRGTEPNTLRNATLGDPDDMSEGERQQANEAVQAWMEREHPSANRVYGAAAPGGPAIAEGSALRSAPAPVAGPSNDPDYVPPPSASAMPWKRTPTVIVPGADRGQRPSAGSMPGSSGPETRSKTKGKQRDGGGLPPFVGPGDTLDTGWTQGPALRLRGGAGSDEEEGPVIEEKPHDPYAGSVFAYGPGQARLEVDLKMRVFWKDKRDRFIV